MHDLQCDRIIQTIQYMSCFSAIYRWITVKNLNLMEFDQNVDTNTPMGLLRGIKYGTESYHVLFKRLCRCVHYCYFVFVENTNVSSIAARGGS